MQYDTQMLILQLLREEGRRADHRATLFYKKEIDDALSDFISFLNKHPETLAKSSWHLLDNLVVDVTNQKVYNVYIT